MIRKILREYYLLPRGEQRAMLLLSLLVLFTLGVRVAVGMLPAREPAGLEKFKEEAMGILSALAEADSLKQLSLRLNTSYNTPYNARYGVPSDAKSMTSSKASTIDLNKADSLALLSLPGIGPVFAGRIVKYRHILGGYCRIEQLSEIYGMRQETVGLVTPYLVLDTAGLEKLPVNSCSFRELLRHPYLEYEDVKAIMHYIEIEGKIGSLEEIRLNALLADSTLERIAPYIDFTF